MPKVSVNILTNNRAAFLKQALGSVLAQTFQDYEVVVVNDGSTDNTPEVLKFYQSRFKSLQIISHNFPNGITQSRQQALMVSQGDYVAVLDDDDVWQDPDKLKKQVEFLDAHPDHVLVGGRISIGKQHKARPTSNKQIRQTMLFRNNFFTSTVMFRQKTALKAGGFVTDGADLAEDYDLWLRLGKFGKFYNFPEVFTLYAKPQYNKERFKHFLAKQLRLIGRHKTDYPYYYLAGLILRLRLKFYIF